MNDHTTSSEKLDTAAADAPTMTRKGFLIASGASLAVLFGLGALGAEEAHAVEHLRPPGGQDGTTLLGACIKCDRCRSACPQNVIDVGHLEDGIANARTPILDFTKGYCDFCEGHAEYRCVQSCPTGALLAGFDPEVNALGIARVNTDECLLYRSGSGSCSKQCIGACAYSAIELVDGELLVDESQCNGCGACEFFCPSTSYGSFTGTMRRGISVEC